MATRNVLCFGDSLTWGWVPKDPPVPSERFGPDVRWTGVVARLLGDGYRVLEEGLSGRTTTADDPTDPRLNGSRHLPGALATHLPLDLVVLMLGTNDTKALLRRSPFEIATGVSVLLDQVAASAGGVGTAYPAPRVLVVCPPPLGDVADPWFREVFAGAREKTLALPALYRAVAGFSGASFFDAGSVISTDGVDGVHLTEQNNRDLGEALAPVVRDALS
ncbi:SGNH/GDSL hydrolase family protein [Quadrisphaera sp. DSM 44207]|uniref:SGNH/GDSL hydrolase family protein n=1 Tax=Quadrisphaera sp. DSM 44207 TaxID=1881057 RepID=UPI0008814E50|nr:SGNH/GDSL hydrolase family protein [Quadrisphaera sp. DSM 44207]SDQ07014.1 Lysophospholipase L1 [Quadrisphaera sp. DSM 44207]